MAPLVRGFGRNLTQCLFLSWARITVCNCGTKRSRPNFHLIWWICLCGFILGSSSVLCIWIMQQLRNSLVWKNGLEHKYNGVWSLFHFITVLSLSNTVDVGSEGRASGVGLTDGAWKQRKYSNYFSQFESSEMLQKLRTFTLIKSYILKSTINVFSPAEQSSTVSTSGA